MKVSRTFHISILLSVMFALFACCASADILNYASEKSNALIVIGEKATAEDVIGSLGLATGMYSEPLQTSPIAALVESGAIKLPDGYDKTVSVLGDVVAIDTATDRLEAVERLGNVRPVLTEDDTRSLASGTLTTQQGTTQYNQYLRFETTTNPASADYVASGFVSLRQDDDDQVNIFLLFEEDTRIFEYELEFQEGLSTEIDCVGSSTACTAADERRLTDLESLKFNMLGTEFMILEARATTDDDSITLHLIGDGIEALFEEGETQIFNIGGKEYEITPLIISDSTNTVKFRINGKTTKEYSPGDIDKTIDDLYIGVSEILPNEAGETAGGDLVKILLGKKSIEFKDTNYTDDSVYENIQINDDTITGTEVKIKATLQSSDELRINDIKYRLKAESSDFGTVYIPAGYNLRSKLRYPEAMLTDNWNIVYYGSAPDPFMHANRVDFMPQGDDSYKLIFKNSDGLQYDIPFVDNSDDSSMGFKYGTDDDQLRFFECMNTSDFCIGKHDDFILTNSKSGYSKGGDTSVTHVIEYDSVDSEDNIIYFNDLATGSFSATYTGTEGSGASGTVSVGGQTYTFYVGGATNYSIAFDQNDDGDVNNDEVNIIIKGGGILDLGPNQTCDQNVSALDAFNMTIMTLADNFDENGWLNFGLPEVVVMSVYELSSNEVDMDVFPTLTGLSRYKFPDDDAYFSSSAYGTYALEDDDSGNSDYIKFTYPEKEGFPQVYVTFGQVSVIPLSIYPLLGPIPLETFLDEPYANTLLAKAQASLDGIIAQSRGTVSVAKPPAGETTKLDSQVTLDELKSKAFIVLLGGPCVNTYVADLASEGLTHTCEEWQSLEGKGMLQSLTTEFGPTLIVAGFSGADTLRASFVLQNLDRYKEQLYGKNMTYVEQKDEEMVFS